MAKYLDENGLASVWSKFKSLLNSHINNRNNPHQLTKNQIGLNNVDNTSDLNKPISTATQNALGGKYNYFTHPKGTYDADNITQVGRHYFAEESTLTHFPNPSYSVGKFDMVVENGAEGMLIQRTAYDGDEEYLRTKMGSGSWSSWKHIQSVDDTMISGWNAKASTAVATPTTDGLLAAADKTKLNGIATGATKVIVEQSLVNQSSNPLAGKVVQEMIGNVMHGVTELGNQLDGKVDKVTGKGLSTNDYTTAEKNKLAAFGAASTYALKADIAGMYKYKGSVADATKLPTTGQVTGDVYNIVAASVYGGPGANVAWDGTRWDSLGEIFQVTSMTASEIDAICV